jgi:hypothetical protein
LEKSNGASKAKRTTSLRDVTRRVWKKRSFPFKRKGQRGDMPSFNTQPLSGSDDAASQGRQDNDFEAPQASQSAVLFLSRIEGYGSCRHLRRGDAETLLVIVEP